MSCPDVIKTINEGKKVVDGLLTRTNIFYAVVGSIMGGFGLLYNSNPVVLGSMLVSPLGNPIFRTIVNIIKSDFLKSFNSIIALISLISICYLTGNIMGIFNDMTEYFETPTEEMEKRASISHIVIDVMIAIVAGVTLAFSIFKKDLVPIAGINLIISFLPPIVNSGIYHGFILSKKMKTVFPSLATSGNMNNSEVSVKNNFLKGKTSMILGLVNILSVFIAGFITFKLLCGNKM